MQCLFGDGKKKLIQQLMRTSSNRAPRLDWFTWCRRCTWTCWACGRLPRSERGDGGKLFMGEMRMYDTKAFTQCDAERINERQNKQKKTRAIHVARVWLLGHAVRHGTRGRRRRVHSAHGQQEETNRRVLRNKGERRHRRRRQP